MGSANDVIFLIEQHEFWLHLRLGEGEGHDGDALARFDPMGGPAVDQDFSGIGFPFEDISFQTCAGGDGCHEHFFTRPQVSGHHEIRGDLDAAFVIDISVGDHGTVEFGLQNLAKHGREQNPTVAQGQVASVLNLPLGIWGARDRIVKVRQSIGTFDEAAELADSYASVTESAAVRVIVAAMFQGVVNQLTSPVSGPVRNL